MVRGRARRTRASARRNARTRSATRVVASLSEDGKKISNRSQEISGSSSLVPHTSANDAESPLNNSEEDSPASQSESQIAGPSIYRQSEDPVTPPPNTPPTPTVSNLQDSSIPQAPDKRKDDVRKWDTPKKANLSQDTDLRSMYCNAQREAIMNDLGISIPQVSNEYLFDHVLPPLRKDLNFPSLCEKLRKRRTGGIRQDRNGDYAWHSFLKNASEGNNPDEATFFNKPLTEIFNTLIREANTQLGPINTLTFQADGGHKFWPGDIKPDASLSLKKPEEKIGDKSLWCNTAVSFLFKRYTKDKYDNIKQVAHSLQHVMAVDPCRRFTYGIQMDRLSMRVWFRSRSSILISNEFNLNKDYENVSRIFLSLLYASKSELGWDPTISTELVGGIRNHTIHVSGVCVTTNETLELDVQKANSIIGSGTRIYKANKIVNGEEAGLVVLKDHWLEDGRISEPEIRDLILKDITDTDDRNYVDKHVLSCLSYEQVKVDDVVDHTEKVMLRGKSPDYSQQYKFPIPPEIGLYKRASKPTGGDTDRTRKTTDIRAANTRKSYPHRSHYRILYNEVATPFYDLTNSKDILIVTIDVIETLLRIHKAGWVHRDISTGNIYLYIDPVTGEKRGMLGDLEFAKKVGTGARYDVRTGTLDFMAAEIAYGSYLFASDDDEGDVDTRAMKQALREKRASKSSQANMGPGICYNYIHDIESVWWIMVWALFSFEKKARSGNDVLDSLSSGTRRDNKRTLFPGILTSGKRYVFIQKESHFSNAVNGCIPQYFSDLTDTVRVLRKVIVKTYKKKEIDEPEVIEFDSSKDDGVTNLHRAFISTLRDTLMEDFEIVLVRSSGCGTTASKRATEGKSERLPKRRKFC